MLIRSTAIVLAGFIPALLTGCSEAPNSANTVSSQFAELPQLIQSIGHINASDTVPFNIGNCTLQQNTKVEQSCSWNPDSSCCFTTFKFPFQIDVSQLPLIDATEYFLRFDIQHQIPGRCNSDTSPKIIAASFCPITLEHFIVPTADLQAYILQRRAQYNDCFAETIVTQFFTPTKSQTKIGGGICIVLESIDPCYLEPAQLISLGVIKGDTQYFMQQNTSIPLTASANCSTCTGFN